MAVVLFEPGREIVLGHIHPAGIIVANVKDDQRLLVSLRDTMNLSRAAKSVHYPKANGVFIEHGREHAAHGAFLAPDLDPVRLLVPEVATVGSGYGACVLGGIVPGRDSL